MQVVVTLTSSGQNAGPYNLYSNIDYGTPLATGITPTALLAGYTLSNVPDNATTIRCTSTGTCTNSQDFAISGLPAVTPTPTPTVSPVNYSTIGVYSGTSSTQACQNIFLMVVYYQGSIVVNPTTGTILYKDPGLTQVVDGTSAAPRYYNTLSTVWVVANSEGRIGSETTCPAATPTPTPTRTPGVVGVQLQFQAGTTTSICGATIQTGYTQSGNIEYGQTLYYNSQLTSAVTGYNYVTDPNIGQIFNIGSSNALIGTNSGQSC